MSEKKSITVFETVALSVSGKTTASKLMSNEDEVSMIFFTVDPGPTDHFYRLPRRSRQMFFYKENTLFQSRLYPSDLSEPMDLYRGIVQKAIATCLGVPNRWILKKKRDDVNECCSSGEGRNRKVSVYKTEIILEFKILPTVIVRCRL